MDVNPVHTSLKRPRAKSAVKDPSAKPARQTLTARRKPSASANVVATTPDVPLDLTEMIATTAFYLSAERGFVPGHELDDWLEAERRVRARYPS